MAVVMVAAEQTGFSSGAPKRRRTYALLRAERNKNFLIKSLTCASRGRFVSFFVETRRSRERKGEKGGGEESERRLGGDGQK